MNPPAPIRLSAEGLLGRAGITPSFNLQEIDQMARKNDARKLMIDLDDGVLPILHSWVYLMPTAEDYDSRVLRGLQLRTFGFAWPLRTKENTSL